jgi:signal transduction histidine kinase
LAVSVAVIGIVLFGLPLGVAVYQYAAQSEQDQLRQVADALAIVVADDLEDDEDIDHPEYLTGAGCSEMAVYDEDGDWSAGALPEEGGSELASALRGTTGVATDDARFVVAVPITHSDDVIGAVRATAPRSAVLREVVPAWGLMAGLAALAVGATWIVGRWQARRLALPLEELVGVARRLGEGDFSVRARTGGLFEIDAVGSALNTTAVRLDDLLARERAFSADVSHQLRTPLAGMRLRLEATREQPDFELRRAIDASLGDADRLSETIEELLSLARDRRQVRTPLDLAALLGELSPEWHDHLARLGRALEVSIEPGTPDPRASAAAVREVLAVLIDNAARHGAGTVAVMARELHGAVAIDVCDEGPGVGSTEPVLFTRSSQQGDGHGIGLPLARRLAEGEQGRLELTRPSPPVFTLLLPSSADEAPPRWQDGVAVAAAGAEN